MQRKTFDGMNCSIARSLDQIGEWWTLLIIRECTMGTTRFDDFQRHLGIARNILTNRLNRLTDQGILEKTPIGNSERFFDYRLTRKGEELFPVLIALLQWGDRWSNSKNGAPIKLVDERTRKAVERIHLRSADGRVLGIRDVRLKAGPGATDVTRAIVAGRNQAIFGGEMAIQHQRHASRRAPMEHRSQEFHKEIK
jgi:DNA-binding HxlR family transcriptional regulator